MIRPHLLPSLTAGLALASAASNAAAQSFTTGDTPAKPPPQASPLPDSIPVGQWTFRPTVEVRIRGEYRRHPFDAGGDVYDPTAVLAADYKSSLPPLTSTQPGVKDQYFVTERARIGIGVDRGPVTAQVTLQDARVWGEGTGFLTGSSGSLGASPLVTGAGQPVLPSFAPYEAYIDVHTRSGRRVFFRVGRQKVVWGDGRLLGDNDWSITGRSLDAARFGFQLGDVDVELLAAMLAAPGRYDKPVDTASGAPATTLAEGSGSQLYGVNVVYHALPLLNVEVTGFARIVRDPVPSSLTPSNTFVIDGRLSGDRRGFHYGVEGAYELGSVASFGTNRDLRAFAFAGHASWETALPGHLTFSAEGAYASGDKGETTGKITRFDPLLPDEHTFLSPMSVVAWSNVISGGGSIALRPADEVGLLAGYHYAALAEPGGRWSSAALYPIGGVPANTARSLGHEIDAAIRIVPWKPFEIETGYGIFLRGAGADAILIAAQRAATLQHWAYLQTTVRMP